MKENKSNDYERLEDQIGNIGGDIDETTDQKSQSLGKLMHKSSYGQKEDLTKSEQEDLQNFLAKGRLLKQKSDKENAPISEGWIPLSRDEMGLRGDFYPASWQFFIRPATLNAIKNWTAVDEEKAADVNNVFNEIIKTCVKIETTDISKPNWTHINSWDRFWFILKIREYTFPDNENTVKFTDVCSECGEEMTYELNSSNLFYEYPDDELIEKYWHNNHWEIDPTEYDVNHDIITLYTPKLGKDEAIIEWASNKVRNKQKLDETFIKYLIWLLDRPASDPQMLDRQIQKIYNEYKTWDMDMFNFMTDVINNININPSEQLKTTCPSCGREATSTVQFPNGIKVLFAYKSNNKKFGSR